VGVSEAFRRANKESYDYVALYGSREAEEGVVTLKNMDSGETEKVEVE
jgi:histidyl-tRNA synthetase